MAKPELVPLEIVWPAETMTEVAAEDMDWQEGRAAARYREKDRTLLVRRKLVKEFYHHPIEVTPTSRATTYIRLGVALRVMGWE